MRSNALRVILEIGPKRRVVAGALDWPGLDRWGVSDEGALANLGEYLPRYAGVAERAGLKDAFAGSHAIEIIERVRGSSSTDFWGIAHVPSQVEREVLAPADLERRLTLLQACWATFDEVAARVSPALAKGPRGGGRDRDEIVEHVHASEWHNWAPKVGVRTELASMFTPAGLTAHRQAYLDAIRAYNAEGRQARTWPIQFLIRRTAHHVMDHAWEMEDKDLGQNG